MSNLFYIYLASGVFFLLIEMLTATFYGLAISVASFILAVYVFVTGDVNVTVLQGIIFVIISAICAYALPKWLQPNTEALKSGLDTHVGKSFRLERVGADWKVKVDGVDYLIDDDSETPEFEAGKKVRLESHRAGVLKVSLMESK